MVLSLTSLLCTYEAEINNRLLCKSQTSICMVKENMIFIKIIFLYLSVPSKALVLFLFFYFVEDFSEMLLPDSQKVAFFLLGHMENTATIEL